MLVNTCQAARTANHVNIVVLEKLARMVEKLARMVKVIAMHVVLVNLRMTEIQRAKIVRWDFIQIKIFKLQFFLVKIVHRVRIHLLQVYPVLVGATIVHLANIQWKKAIPNRLNAKNV